MAILEVRKFPDKILRQKAQPVDIITDSELRLIRDMFDTLYFANGVGLAAPQVGVLKRIIVCNPTGKRTDELAIINPKIIYQKGKVIKDCEGCLSIPTMTGEVARFSKIGVSGKGLNGRDFVVDTENLLARIVAHECDHLDGILFIDRLGFLKKKILIHNYKKKLGLGCVGRWY
ncbi:MAG: peptide deformylase [Candidatus Omnitrophica bacterium]|nr:peptide deformylase [Candidatus Omnitrophota bacterium]